MSELMENIMGHVGKSQFPEAMKILSDSSTNVSEKKELGYDLIFNLLDNLSKDSECENRELGMFVNDLVELIAENTGPEEIIKILEQMDNANGRKFRSVLRVLGVVLPRCRSENKMKYIESSLVTIRSCLEDFFMSDTEFTTDEDYEEAMLEKLPEIETVLKSVAEFYEIFVSLILTKTRAQNKEEMVNLFSSRLLQLLDFFVPLNDENKFKSLNEIYIQLLNLILKLLNDPFKLLEFIFVRILKHQNDVCERGNKMKHGWDTENLRNMSNNFDIEYFDENISPFESNYIISNLGYAQFFYSILCDNYLENLRLRLVYNPKYIFLSLVSLSTYYFEKNSIKYIDKGLHFIKTLLNLMNDFKLQRSELYFKFHDKILTQLKHIMVYSENENTRRKAVSCFKNYIQLFDYEGKYYLLNNFRSKVEHSGTLGLLIDMLKEYISHFIDSGPEEEEHSEYYCGKFLFHIISKYCFLSEGEKTDLVANADHVISSLNLMRFLLLKDKGNKSGIRSYLKSIDEGFIKPLENDIRSSREYYKIRLEECKIKSGHDKSDNKMELTINSQVLENLTEEQEENSIYLSLNAIDLIDSLLSHLQQCVEININYVHSFK